MENNFDRPYVIYHMTLSLDGKITGDFLTTSLCESAVEFYYRNHREFRGLEFGSEKNEVGENRAKGFLCGRVTMQGSFTGFDLPYLSGYKGQAFDREDFIANPNAEFYAVAVDTKGKLNWKDSTIYDEDPGYDKCHVIEVLCENVKDEYLAFLRDKGISYVFAGESELDLQTALKKLKNSFGIDKLLLEGGGIIGGKFAKDNAIDELSFVTAPVIEGGNAQSVFADNFTADTIRDFKPIETEADGHGCVWVRYVRGKF